MIYLLDANVVIKFQRAGHLGTLCRAADRLETHLVEPVYAELAVVKDSDKPQARGRKRIAREHLQEGGPIVIDEIRPETPESALLDRLRDGKTTARDLGEAASVALAYHRPELVFVCGDTNGILSALNELHGSGERVLRPHVFLRHLADRGLLTAAETRACALEFKDFGIAPSWWAAWLASL